MAGEETKRLQLEPQAAVQFVAEKALELFQAQQRRVAVGLVGGPGVGKSTLAAEIVSEVNRRGLSAALVPMDGFHMRHAKLEALGTVKDKGAAHTFEGAAFVDFLAKLKAATEPVSGPGYSRKIEDVVDDAFTIAPDTQILVVEGNYLLLQSGPWVGVKPLLDLAVFLHVPRGKVKARLLKRHGEEGLFTDERNREHVDRVDLANYDLVEQSQGAADLMIDLITEH